jgi:hypothetical protein
MGLLDQIKAHLNGSSDKPKAQGGAANPKEGQGGGTGQPTTMDEFLTQIQAQRPTIEKQFEAKALLEASNLVTDSKIDPAIQAHVAYEFLTAMADDALIGGTVLFVSTNASGEQIEAEGTRLEQAQAKYAAMPRHSMAESRVRAVHSGRAAAPQVLGETRPAGQGKVYQEAGDNGVETMSDDELLQTSPQGQSAIANRNNNGNGNRARLAKIEGHILNRR